MDQLGLEVLLAFALVGLAFIILAWTVVRKLRRASAHEPVASTTSHYQALYQTPANSSAPTSPQFVQAQAAKPAREPSYTEVAVAAGGLRPSSPACTQTRIDYSDAATDIGTGASYAAIAVAEAARAARNLPPLSSTANNTATGTPHSGGNGKSYTEIAIATVGEFTPKRPAAAPPVRIDYATTAAEAAAASASYAAIAVASAARNA